MRWKFNKTPNYFTSNAEILKFHNKSVQYDTLISKQTPKLFHELNRSYLPYKNELNVEVDIDWKKYTIFSNRRSSWQFEGKKLEGKTFLEFIRVCFGSSGNKDVELRQGNTIENIDLRMYPSGGSLYPVKIYILINNVENFAKGIYEYRIVKQRNYLGLIKQLDQYDLDLFSSFKYNNDKSFEKVNFMVFLASDISKNTRYGMLQYRLTLLETGHIAENIMLLATELELKSVPIGGFFEKDLNEFLGIHKLNETVLYYLGVG